MIRGRCGEWLRPPVEWFVPVVKPASKIPGGALPAQTRCTGRHDRPDGDVAALALIKLSATETQSLISRCNPGGPGESVSRPAGVFRTLPKRVHERFDLVTGSTPRGGVALAGDLSATPMPTTTGCGRAAVQPGGV